MVNLLTIQPPEKRNKIEFNINSALNQSNKLKHDIFNSKQVSIKSD